MTEVTNWRDRNEAAVRITDVANAHERYFGCRPHYVVFHPAAYADICSWCKELPEPTALRRGPQLTLFGLWLAVSSAIDAVTGFAIVGNMPEKEEKRRAKTQTRECSERNLEL